MWFVRGTGRLLSVALLVAIGYLAFTAVQVVSTGHRDQRDPADAIVVLGAAQYDGVPSPVFAARLDHGLMLWREGVAPRIVVTGGRVDGDSATEASAAAGYLIARGVPDNSPDVPLEQEDLLLETDARSTWESLAAVRQLLDRLEVRRVVLVSDPSHALRSALIADELGLEVQISSTRTSPASRLGRIRQGVRETLGVGLGRLIGHRRLTVLERVVREETGDA